MLKYCKLSEASVFFNIQIEKNKYFQTNIGVAISGKHTAISDIGTVYLHRD